MIKFLKNIIFLPVIWSWLFTLCLLLYVLSHLPRSFSGRYYHFLSRYWCGILVRALDVDLTLIHKNNHALPEQYILIANHPSALEDFGVPALFDIYPLAKEGVRDWVILGRISDYAGTIYVKRGDATSRHEALESLINAVKSGKNIVLFPEGGCKGSRIYEKFHTGAFDVSLQTGVPILPVFLHYVDEKTFEWTDQSLPLKLWQIFKSNKNKVNYYVHDIISPTMFSDKNSFAKYAHTEYLKWQDEYLGK